MKKPKGEGCLHHVQYRQTYESTANFRSAAVVLVGFLIITILEYTSY